MNIDDLESGFWGLFVQFLGEVFGPSVEIRIWIEVLN